MNFSSTFICFGLLLFIFYTSQAFAIPTTSIEVNSEEETLTTEGCENLDNDSLCQQLSNSGYCSDPEVLHWCKMTCGGCKGSSSVLRIHGGYTNWGPWSRCNQTCAGGFQQRSRSCTNPHPANGGKDCIGLGPAAETRRCNTQRCPVCTDIVGDSRCQQWFKAGYCSNPTISYWCLGTCGRCQGVTLHGGYSDWGSWSPCSQSCGGGLQQRSRSCTNPQPVKGGLDCSGLGPAAETRRCNTQPCPACTNIVANSRCQLWFNAGYCSNPTIGQWCIKTCGRCQVCKNTLDDSRCQQWFHAGYCSNPTIGQWCKKTCGSCV